VTWIGAGPEARTAGSKSSFASLATGELEDPLCSRCRKEAEAVSERTLGSG
jgi:hypothetical protein